MSGLLKDILTVALKAIKEVQKKSLEQGIPNVYCKNKTIYFQLPDGTITQDIPKEFQKVKSK